jgi:hypothetical protein
LYLSAQWALGYNFFREELIWRALFFFRAFDSILSSFDLNL